MKWIERKFEFDFDDSNYHQLIDRLRETPSRLESLLESLSAKWLVSKDGKNWSIQENAGHLSTVDDLFIGRLDDYENNFKKHRPADMSGGGTIKANYNSKNIEDILTDFRKKREAYVKRLENYNSSKFSQSAWHPRLEKPMRLCDMLFFQAEHDDHHLGKIQNLINNLNKAENSI